jgi:5'-nucleotidase
MSTEKFFLIINDDGIDAPGIKALWEALRGRARLGVVAPDQEQSGVGMGISLRTPLHMRPVTHFPETDAWAVSGTPADCVKMGVSVLFDQKPDLIISGINAGSNSGCNLLYSGTVGGVIEGILKGIPGIAFSSESMPFHGRKEWSLYINQVVDYLLEEPLPSGSLMNVSFPESDLEIQGMRLAKQGASFWEEAPDRRQTPAGQHYCWLGGRYSDHDEDEASDVHLLRQGYVTAVPIHVGELTDQDSYHARKNKFDQLAGSKSP